MTETILDQSLRDAHEVAFMCRAYPDKKMKGTSKEDQGIGEMFIMPVLQFNAAAWRAEDLDLIEIAKDGSNDVRIAHDPEEWQFREETTTLIRDLEYILRKFAENESDLEGQYFENWTLGYLPQSIFIAVKYLLKQGVIAEYELTNVVEIEPSKKARGRGKKAEKSESVHTFYTLAENLDKQWGRKMFPDQSKLK